MKLSSLNPTFRFRLTNFSNAQEPANSVPPVRTAQEAAQAQNAEGFLSAVGSLRDPSIGISTRDYLRLSLGATTLGLQRASSLILQHGRKKHPADEGIFNVYLGALAHSYEPEERGLARRLIEEEMGTL